MSADAPAMKRRPPHHHHVEHHQQGSAFVRDVVLGMADGLTVPFALAAGVSSAGGGSTIVVTAGLAEIVAGTISMGVGGFLAARSEMDHYESEYKREVEETDELPSEERAEVAAVFRGFGISGELLGRLVDAIASDRERWVEFMMRFELGLDKPDVHRAPISAATIGGAYAVGGFVPLIPYLLVHSVPTALVWSAVTTLVALAVFGAFRARFGGRPPLQGAVQTTLTGGFAAGAAFLLAKLVAHPGA